MEVEIKAAVAKLSLKPGDVLVIDGTQGLDIESVVNLQLPEVTWEVPIVVAYPRGEATVEQALRTCSVEYLREVLAVAEAK